MEVGNPFEKQSLDKPPPKQSANPVFCQSFHDKMFCFRIDLSRFVTRWLRWKPFFFEAILLLPARRFCDFLTAHRSAYQLPLPQQSYTCTCQPMSKIHYFSERTLVQKHEHPTFALYLFCKAFPSVTRVQHNFFT